MILKKTNIVIITLLILFVSCNNMFEYSPYNADVKDKFKNTTNKNLQQIKEIQINTDTFKFAFVTDNHYKYNNLRTVVEDINNRNDIRFVIFGGDIAHQGLLKEYQIFHDILENLNKPYLTVIGNHDYLSNGEVIYKQMFGDYNYSFVFNNNKFVIFDDVFWESNKTPDFNWLETQLYDNQKYNQLFVIAHIPPISDEFNVEPEQIYSTLMKANNVSLSIHGHTHSYYFGEIYNDGVYYLTVPWLEKPTYCIITVYEKSFETEIIEK